MKRHLTMIVTASLLTAGAAFAETAAAPAGDAAAPAGDAAANYEAARNQLGVLKYCQAQGHIGADAAAIQEKMIAMLPPGDVARGDAAEAAGAGGKVIAMGQEMTLEDGAKAQNTTVEALCQQMDGMMKQLGAQLPG